MRTVFLGTSEFAAAVLRRLAESPHRPARVVTRPDAPRGRGRKLAAPPVAGAARELGLDLDQPESVNAEEARARIEAARPEAVCVCAFGALVREPLLSAYPMLNVHPSLLPRWRGAAPVERAIMAGDAETGVSIMQLVAELDAGPVALRAADPIGPDDTYGSLAPRLERIGGDLLVEALDRWPVEFAPQDEAGVTYAEKIGPQDRTLDPSRPAAELERTVRALTPHIGARAALPEGEFLRIHEAAPAAGDGAPDTPGRGGSSGAADSPGAALFARDGRLFLRAADGALELRTVQPPGGRAMAAGDFLRGHDVPAR
ncbi:MAG TPA: methionyl-tRNA formyltransferase [Solirubrobacteraceae bacterium]|nr:methionyl-tRNA formyltransferase [Solirubrobacteraceae bacterium]